MTAFVAHIDGGARGNPGPAGWGAVIADESGGVVAEIAGTLPHATNNVAEYHGLLAALAWCAERGATAVHVRSDSLLLASSLLALGGAILVFLGTLLPIAGGGADAKLIGGEAENWFALQPIVGAVTLAGIAVLLLVRPSKRLLTSGLLIGTGVQCLLFYFSYLAFYGRVDGLSPGSGVYLGLAGGALVVHTEVALGHGRRVVAGGHHHGPARHVGPPAGGM